MKCFFPAKVNKFIWRANNNYYYSIYHPWFFEFKFDFIMYFLVRFCNIPFNAFWIKIDILLSFCYIPWFLYNISLFFCTGCAIKIQSHIFSPTGYNSNFSAVFGLAADKVHQHEFFKRKSSQNLDSFKVWSVLECPF